MKENQKISSKVVKELKQNKEFREKFRREADKIRQERKKLASKIKDELVINTTSEILEDMEKIKMQLDHEDDFWEVIANLHSKNQLTEQEKVAAEYLMEKSTDAVKQKGGEE